MRKQPDVWVEITTETYPAGVASTTRRSTKAMAYPTKIEGRIVAGSFSPIERALSDWQGNVEAAVFSWEEEDSDGFARQLAAEMGLSRYARAEVAVKMLSEEGRKAGLTPRVIQRGYLTKPPVPLPGRRAKYEAVDAIGSQFYHFNPEGPLQSEFISREHLAPVGITGTPGDKVGKPYNIVIGEFTDRGAATVCGESAVKGLIPPDYVGRFNLTLGGGGGIGTSPPATSSVATPAPVLTARVVGAGGSATYYYAVTLILPDGSETGFSNVVTVTGAPALGDMGPTNYVLLEWTAPTGWEGVYDDAAAYRVMGRTANPPTTYLTLRNNGGTYVTPETSFRDGSTQTGSAAEALTERPLGSVGCGTAQTIVTDQGEVVIGAAAWGVLVVALGAVQILSIYGSDLATNTNPARVLIDPNDPNVISPLSNNWPHPTPYVDVNGTRLTLFYARGSILQQHIDGTVTFAVNCCGVEDVGDGSGTMISEAGPGLQWLLNEIVLNRYRTGDYGPLATYADGTPILKTSAFAAMQAATVEFIGGRGYQIGLAIIDRTTLTEALQWWATSFNAYVGVTQHGQVAPFVIQNTAPRATFEPLRERFEIDGPLAEPELAEDEVENRIRFKWDWDPDAQAWRMEEAKVEDQGSQDMYGVREASGDFLGLRATRDEVTARDAMGRRLRLNRFTSIYQEVELGMPGFERNVGEMVRMTHRDGITTNGYQDHAFFVTRQGFDLNAPQQRVRLMCRFIDHALSIAMVASDSFGAQVTESISARTYEPRADTPLGLGEVADVVVTYVDTGLVGVSKADPLRAALGEVVTKDLYWAFETLNKADSLRLVAATERPSAQARPGVPAESGRVVLASEGTLLVPIEDGRAYPTFFDPAVRVGLVDGVLLRPIIDGVLWVEASDPAVIGASESGISPVGLRFYLLKQATEQRTSTVLADDAELYQDVGANQKWFVEWILCAASASSVPGFKAEVSVPSGSVGFASFFGAAENTATQTTALMGTSATFGPITHPALSGQFIVRAVIKTGAVGGQIKLRWAQAVSSSYAVILYGASNPSYAASRSRMEAVRLP